MDEPKQWDWIERRAIAATGSGLTPLQRAILEGSLYRCTYAQMAERGGYSEGHLKDVGAELWQNLSHWFGERVTKRNFSRFCHQRTALNHSLTATALSPRFPLLIGREEAVADLETAIARGANAIVIHGEGGLGKTTFAQYFLQNQPFDLRLELMMAKDAANLTPAMRVVEEWLRQDFQVDPGTDYGIALARLKRQLRDRRVGISIDNLEPALDGEGRFVSEHRNYIELLRVLCDPSLPVLTLITSRDRLCEPDLALTHYRLPQLSRSAWQAYFERKIAVAPETLTQMHCAYGGNAKAMGILLGTIAADYRGNMAEFWQEHRGDPLAVTDLKHLVASQLDRLQSLDGSAYQLLLRMGCYRYQSLPRLPKSALVALLWDVAPESHAKILHSLRQRTLAEWEAGEYWLHPAIRAEAAARLARTPDWEKAHRQAAAYWTESIATISTSRDALQALEAYYHYWAIGDSEAAAGTILRSRHNQWRQFLPLGSTLYRMGLLQPVIGAIQSVMDCLPVSPKKSELYNIWGDLCWIRGQIPFAITCQEQALAIAQQFPTDTTDARARYYATMLEVDSLLSLGLYHGDLWALERSADYFQRAIALARDTPHHSWAEKAQICLAWVYSCLERRSDAFSLADPLYHSWTAEIPKEQAGRLAYFLQRLGQTYLNLRSFDRASLLLDLALDCACSSYYQQVEAKTLVSLAELARLRRDFELAETHLEAAIALLDGIGALSDLAEAYWQLSLTQPSPVCQSSLNRAIHLWQEIPAPLQIGRTCQLTSQAGRIT